MQLQLASSVRPAWTSPLNIYCICRNSFLHMAYNFHVLICGCWIIADLPGGLVVRIQRHLGSGWIPGQGILIYSLFNFPVYVVMQTSVSPSIHPSFHFLQFIRSGLWWQQAKQGISDVPVPSKEQSTAFRQTIMDSDL